MCIIAYKSQKGKFDERAMLALRTSFDRNPDGAGFMFPDVDSDGLPTVNLAKGFMTWEDFEEAMTSYALFDRAQVAFHFRVRTHGEKAPGNTHPFPISEDEKVLTGLDVFAPVGLMHNGVIDVDAPTNKLSDTQVFIRDYLGPVAPMLVTPKAMHLLRYVHNSKFLTMFADGYVQLFGRFEDEDGWAYSNFSYKSYSYHTPALSDTASRRVYPKAGDTAPGKDNAVSRAEDTTIARRMLAETAGGARADDIIVVPGSTLAKSERELKKLVDEMRACDVCDEIHSHAEHYPMLGLWICDACFMRMHSDEMFRFHVFEDLRRAMPEREADLS